MKNIFILPTDKPSMLYYHSDNILRFISDNILFTTSQHIYITNDEEIKRGDYFISLNGDESYLDVILNNEVDDFNEYADVDWIENCKKIILTTDQDLIKDGVQVIDDKFLEWFVKNPSCEFVEIKENLVVIQDKPLIQHQSSRQIVVPHKIIIPQEEPKIGENSFENPVKIDWSGFPKSTQEQVGYVESKEECTCENPTDNTCDYCEEENKKEILEEAKKRALEVETLEEAAETYVKDNFQMYAFPEAIMTVYKDGAKWQAERMYSEEDMIDFAEFAATYTDKNRNVHRQMLHAKSKYDGAERTIDLLNIWFEQFKKK